MNLLHGLVQLCFPLRCALCAGAIGATPQPARAAIGRDLLCARCRTQVRWLARGGCCLCQRAGDLPVESSRWPRCADCRTQPLALRACWAAAEYAGPVEDWLRAFKYPRPGLAGLDPVAEGVVAALVREAERLPPPGAYSLVLPIPLHPRRLRARGFNPAALLAREVARQRGLPWRADLLRRVRDTPSQTALTRREREENVAGAFACRPAGLPRQVCLVDDVVTTGATLREAARCLRGAGVEQVVAVCAARTPEHRQH